MTRPAVLAAAVALVSVAVASLVFAQQKSAGTPTDAVSRVSAEQLQSILQNAPLAKDTGKPGEVSTQLFGRAASCSFIRLEDPDLPHVHPVSEIYVMKEGSAMLETGGTMVGPFTNGGVHHRGSGNGEQASNAQQAAQQIGPDHAGTEITGGRTQDVKAGDVILIPAGVNHHWTKVIQPLVYLDIKFPKAE